MTLLNEGLHCRQRQIQNDQSYQTGYDKGRSDAVKQQYWLFVCHSKQAKAGDEGHIRLYPKSICPTKFNCYGVIFKPTTQNLCIGE